MTEKGFATIAIHAGQDPDQWNHRSVVPPLVMSATFKQNSPALPKVSTKRLTYQNSFIHSF